MIPHDYITEWRKHAPWIADEHVEQDLVLSRAVVDIFADEALATALAWRGGTALHKLHLAPSARYSEDIDLVQIKAEPIGDTLTALRAVLDPWLGDPRRVFKEGRVTLIYRFESTGQPPTRQRLKVEINSREHFTVLGHQAVPFGVESRWFNGSAPVTTFALDELLGTKLRALYQRKKGRDLFDLWRALQTGLVVEDRLLHCFHEYMGRGGHSVSRAQFEENLHLKSSNAKFRGDLTPLLRPGIEWDVDKAFGLVLEKLVSGLPGDPWKGLDA